uniref:Uncharacterized protein n=1 Tax=Glossina palpalis gambiensis TaxID=67801 RepID=A0A1B0BFE6_9MUSC
MNENITDNKITKNKGELQEISGSIDSRIESSSASNCWTTLTTSFVSEEETLAVDIVLLDSSSEPICIAVIKNFVVPLPKLFVLISSSSTDFSCFFSKLHLRLRLNIEGGGGRVEDMLGALLIPAHEGNSSSLQGSICCRCWLLMWCIRRLLCVGYSGVFVLFPNFNEFTVTESLIYLDYLEYDARQKAKGVKLFFWRYAIFLIKRE